MRFWLGVHRSNWLPKTDVGIMVSHRVLRDRKRLPRAAGPWVLDSGGFTALNRDGRWDETAEQYADAVDRYRAEIGQLAWASPQDWMCEPRVRDTTGLSVTEHQVRTVENYLQLRDRGPYIAVLQGWERDDYPRHIDMYADAGVDLRDLPLVGLGTVCRRQATREIAVLIEDLSGYGIRLHGYGVKRGALVSIGYRLTSADSMAWSFGARMEPATCDHGHRSCQNCLDYALGWRADTLASMRMQQPTLWWTDA